MSIGCLTGESLKKELLVAIVDDGGVDRRLCEENLKRFGHEVAAYRSGYELISRMDQGFDPDAVVLDHILDDGHTGLMTLEEIRRKSSGVPVIMVTSFSTPHLVNEFMQAGGNGFLPKPISWKDLDAELRRVYGLRERQKRLDLLEEQNRSLRAQKLATDAFCGMVEHELAKPCSVFVGCVDMLMGNRKLQAMPEVVESLETMEQYAKRLALFMRSLMSVCGQLSHHNQPRYAEIRLSELVGSALADYSRNFCRRNGGINMRVEGDGSVLVDPDRFFQVFLNLVDNAEKYSRNSGRIELICRDSGDHLELLVADQGPGIEEHNLPFVFDPFRRFEETGTIDGSGLGLFICRMLVEQMGGSIWVKSEKGKGSTFGLRLRKTRSFN